MSPQRSCLVPTLAKWMATAHQQRPTTHTTGFRLVCKGCQSVEERHEHNDLHRTAILPAGQCRTNSCNWCCGCGSQGWNSGIRINELKPCTFSSSRSHHQRSHTGIVRLLPKRWTQPSAWYEERTNGHAMQGGALLCFHGHSGAPRKPSSSFHSNRACRNCTTDWKRMCRSPNRCFLTCHLHRQSTITSSLNPTPKPPFASCTTVTSTPVAGYVNPSEYRIYKAYKKSRMPM